MDFARLNRKLYRMADLTKSTLLRWIIKFCNSTAVKLFTKRKNNNNVNGLNKMELIFENDDHMSTLIKCLNIVTYFV